MALKNWSKKGFTLRSLVEGSGGEWTNSASGESALAEYYYNTDDLPDELPLVVYEDGVEMILGTLGALEPGEYALGDNDTVGFTTVYVRLTDDSDPDSNEADFIQIPDVFTIVEQESAGGTEIVLVSTNISNYGDADVDFIVYFVDDTGAVYYQYGFTITTTDGPFSLNSKFMLNDGDVIKVQASLPEFSIMFSGDET